MAAMCSTDPPFPNSSLLSHEERARLYQARLFRDLCEILESQPLLETASLTEASVIRARHAEAFYATPSYQRVRDCYPVNISVEEFGGVQAEVFVPAAGVAAKNHRRVLLNLHGGSFKVGSRLTSHIESAPISVLGRIKVVSIDYRMAPEYAFPAASDDVVAAYRALLEHYQPRNIGIYGCSAGALLTAQTLASLLTLGLPLPAAVGMFCAGASYWGEGDSRFFGEQFISGPIEPLEEHPYFKGVDRGDALAFPVWSSKTMGRFPPSLLIASTRDFALSSVVRTHSVLVQHGIEADLHVWEGLGHGFFYDAALLQSRQAHDVAMKFFDRHLGREV